MRVEGLETKYVIRKLPRATTAQVWVAMARLVINKKAGPHLPVRRGDPRGPGCPIKPSVCSAALDARTG